MGLQLHVSQMIFNAGKPRLRLESIRLTLAINDVLP